MSTPQQIDDDDHDDDRHRIATDICHRSTSSNDSRTGEKTDSDTENSIRTCRFERALPFSLTIATIHYRACVLANADSISSWLVWFKERADRTGKKTKPSGNAKGNRDVTLVYPCNVNTVKLRKDRDPNDLIGFGPYRY